MITPYRISRSFRRFRFYHQDSYPLLFIFLGFSLFLLKIAALAIAALLAYKLYTGGYFNLGTKDLVAESDVVIEPQEVTKSDAVTASFSTLVAAPEDTSKEQNTTVTAIESAPRRTLTLERESWILRQDSNHFIVQFGASPDRQLLEEDALRFDSEEPIESVCPATVNL